MKNDPLLPCENLSGKAETMKCTLYKQLLVKREGTESGTRYACILTLGFILILNTFTSKKDK